MPHSPVLYHEILNALNPHNNGYYVDGTLGAGGHAWGILEASSPKGRLFGLDLDPEAIRLSSDRLRVFRDRVILTRASYTSLKKQIKKIGWPCVDGILLDFGVSSMQLDTASRGFSFKNDSVLDMRFDPEGQVTAAKLVNELSERDLAEIIYRYGEERKSRQIARAIVKRRPIFTTKQLADLIIDVAHKKRGKIHPATRTFQALRIATNDELGSIEAVLPQSVDILSSGGRLAVISFHSLEDRIVKHFFQRESKGCICPPEIPICACDHTATIKIITKRPIRPTEDEIHKNPRSRSSRLRVAEKL